MKITNALTLVTLLASATGSDVSVRATPDPVANLTSVTKQLTTITGQLSAKLTTLSADLVKKGNQVASLKYQTSRQDDVIRDLLNQLNEKTKQLQSLDSYCKNHVEDLTDRVHTLETPIGFTVRFRNDSVDQQYKQVGHNQQLVFDYIRYQTGGDNYNKTTGLLPLPPPAPTCSSSRSRDGTRSRTTAWRPASSIKGLNYRLATATACPFSYTSASNMAVTTLKAGDKVSVRTQHSDRISGYLHTSFSGMKLTAH